MDYPAAWKISNSVEDKYHHPKCSARSGMLCDCEVLMTHPDHIKDYSDMKPSWKTYGKWVKGKWVYKGSK